MFTNIGNFFLTANPKVKYHKKSIFRSYICKSGKAPSKRGSASPEPNSAQPNTPLLCFTMTYDLHFTLLSYHVNNTNIYQLSDDHIARKKSQRAPREAKHRSKVPARHRLCYYSLTGVWSPLPCCYPNGGSSAVLLVHPLQILSDITEAMGGTAARRHSGGQHRVTRSHISISNIMEYIQCVFSLLLLCLY